MHADHRGGLLMGERVVPGMSKQLAGVIIATAFVALFAAQSSGLFSNGSQLVLPSSFPFVVLTLVGVPAWFIPPLWGALFVGWNPALLRGETNVPPRTVALWLATAVLSAAYFLVR